MKPPANYTGVLLLDTRDPKKYPVKLSTEQRSLLKAVTHLLESLVPLSAAPSTSATTSITKPLPKDIQRLLSTLIIVFQLNDSSARSINQLYRFFRNWEYSISGDLMSSKLVRRLRYSTMISADITPVGMDNWKKVMCYMDSLLVSMFYSTSSFDFLLDSTADESLAPSLQGEIEELKTLLRFVVNLLRSGEHIKVEIIEQLCLVLNSLGCDLALSYSQQDALQLYEFLAESLSLPLLTMKLDIIHSGKLNLNDDLRLIQERTVLISVPTDESAQQDDTTDSSPNSTSKNNASDVPHITLSTVKEAQNGIKDVRDEDEQNEKSKDANGAKKEPEATDKPSVNLTPVLLEECLNNYFNNSVTVRRHLDKKRERKYVNDSAPIDADELSQYEKLGIVHQSNENDDKSSASIDSKHSDNKLELRDSSSPDMNSLNSNPSLKHGEQPSIDSNVLNVSPSKNDGMSMSTDFSSVISGNSAALVSTTGDSDHLDPYLTRGSISKVSERIEASRTRSSTIVSVLNNVHIPNTTHMTRRSSSISNAEVTLPAWMFLQLLPYYTDPSKNLKFENHEMLYRSRNARSRTIDSTDSALKSEFSNSPSRSSAKIKNDADSSAFDLRFADKRPVVPICLKRYVWDNKGRSHKNSRKVIIPEIMRMPYFIAEDKKKPGFVDFRRNFDNTAPRGSFMLVLDSCVCHRGSSVNSGHYVALTRKKPFDPYTDQVNSDTKNWIIFNDMMHLGHKTREVSFNEAMDTEDPYILFYRVVELHDKNGKPFGEHYHRSGDQNLDEISPLAANAEYDPEREHNLSVATQFSKENTLTKYPSTLESEDRTIKSREQSTVSMKPANSSSKLFGNSPAQLSNEPDLSKSNVSKAGQQIDNLCSKIDETNGKAYGGGSDNSVASANSSDSSAGHVIKIDADAKLKRANSQQSRGAHLQKVQNGRHIGRLGIGKSKSRSSSKERFKFSALDDISPSESFYIGLKEMYYWYKVNGIGEYEEDSFDEPPGVRVLTDDMISDVISKGGEADGGFMDKLNTTLLSLRKGSATSSTLVNFSRHHHHHHHNHNHHHNHEQNSEKIDEQQDSENDDEIKKPFNKEQPDDENEFERDSRERDQFKDAELVDREKLFISDNLAPKSRIPELDSYSISSKGSRNAICSKTSQGSFSVSSFGDSSSVDPLSVDGVTDEETDVKKISASEPVSRLISPAISDATSSSNRVLSLDASRINSKESEYYGASSILAQKHTTHDLSTVTSVKTAKSISTQKQKSHRKGKLRGIFKRLLSWEGKKSA